ncbi:MAG: S8 family serine peptidase, partial [Pseudomonadales bacterium]|nr:S8 family serine peptidase [Pseudomonadales bacterium]
SNNSRSTAQSVTNPVTVGGFANEAGTGPDFDGGATLVESGDEFDEYRVNALGGEVATLTIASPQQGDLDLILYDAEGNMLDFSSGTRANESIRLPDTRGTYHLVVQVFEGYSNYVLSIGKNPASDPAVSGSADIMIGEIVVQQDEQSETPAMLASAREVVGRGRPDYAGPHLYRFGDRIVDVMAPGRKARLLGNSQSRRPSRVEMKLATQLAAKRAGKQKGVKWAEPNYLWRAMLEPNDTYYSLQWHYRQISLPAAWDQTTGNGAVKIAVLDTGLLTTHPELQSRIASDSYDFISSSANSGDGDGIDDDPTDPGDGLDNPSCLDANNRFSSFHGTHVAGTIGAVTNNNLGVAGVTWSGEIMNLRVLGCAGASTFDIAQALRYAAGVRNSHGLVPVQPADIANLSLGGAFASSTMRDAITVARDAGLIVVAAAGNEGDSTVSYPASYGGVISVAATTINDQRAR